MVCTWKVSALDKRVTLKYHMTPQLTCALPDKSQVRTLISIFCIITAATAVPDPELHHHLPLEGAYMAMRGEGAPSITLPHMKALSHDVPETSAAAPTAGTAFKSFERVQQVPADISMLSTVTHRMAQAPSHPEADASVSTGSAAATGHHVIPRRGESERREAGTKATGAPATAKPFEGFPRAIQFAVESSLSKTANHMARAAVQAAPTASKATSEGDGGPNRFVVPPNDKDAGVSALINAASFQEASFCLDKSFGAYQNPGADQRCFYFCTGFQGLGSVQCCAWNSCWRPPAFLLPFGSCGSCPSPPPVSCAPPLLPFALPLPTLSTYRSSQQLKSTDHAFSSKGSLILQVKCPIELTIKSKAQNKSPCESEASQCKSRAQLNAPTSQKPRINPHASQKPHLSHRASQHPNSTHPASEHSKSVSISSSSEDSVCVECDSE